MGPDLGTLRKEVQKPAVRNNGTDASSERTTLTREQIVPMSEHFADKVSAAIAAEHPELVQNSR